MIAKTSLFLCLLLTGSAWGSIAHLSSLYRPSPANTENNYLFTGEQFDPNIGFYYLRARYYNPQVGRFVSMDSYPGSVYDPITLNKYLYANSDPVNHIDPSGKIPIGRLMAGLRGAAIQARYAVTTISRKALNFVKKKKIYDVEAYQMFRPYFHSYMYVAKIGSRKGLSYDVDVNAGSKPLIRRESGFVKAKLKTRSRLRGKKLKITRFTFGQHLLWHASVIGRDTNECKIDYSIIGNNCTTWTVKAIAKALVIARLPI